MQITRMDHRTPILAYCFLGCIAGGPTLLCVADLFWLLAAFRPERDPALIQLLNDLAWVTFTAQVGFLVAQSVFLALAIYLDRQARPVFKPWVGHFNLLIAAAAIAALPPLSRLHQTGLSPGTGCCRSGSRIPPSPFGSS